MTSSGRRAFRTDVASALVSAMLVALVLGLLVDHFNRDVEAPPAASVRPPVPSAAPAVAPVPGGNPSNPASSPLPPQTLQVTATPSSGASPDVTIKVERASEVVVAVGVADNPTERLKPAPRTGEGEWRAPPSPTATELCLTLVRGRTLTAPGQWKQRADPPGTWCTEMPRRAATIDAPLGGG